MKLRPYYYQTPYGGWQYTVSMEESELLQGKTVTASTLPQLMEKVSALFTNNGENFSLPIFERRLCSTLPHGWCEPCEDENPTTDLRITPQRVFNFFMLMMRWWKNGKRFVDLDEAQRRYDLCLRCPHSTREKTKDKANCGVCSLEEATRDRVKKMVGGLGTLDTNPTSLYCTRCGCDMQTRCWFDETKNCWN